MVSFFLQMGSSKQPFSIIFFLSQRLAHAKHIFKFGQQTSKVNLKQISSFLVLVKMYDRTHNMYIHIIEMLFRKYMTIIVIKCVD